MDTDFRTPLALGGRAHSHTTNPLTACYPIAVARDSSLDRAAPPSRQASPAGLRVVGVPASR